MKKELLLAILLFILFSFIFFHPILKGLIPFPGDLLVGENNPYKTYSYGGYSPGGVPNKAQGPDVIRQLFPWQHFKIATFKDGQLPLWNPYNFSGTPFMANFQSAVFYPLNILFFFTDFASAWTIYIFLIPFLSALMLFIFLRELKISFFASLFAGFVFAFSSYMVVWMEYGNIGHAFLFVSIIFFFTEKYVIRSKLSALIGITISFSIAILAGYVQSIFYIFISAILYFLIRICQEKKASLKQIVFYILSLMLGIFITSFQLLPTLELFLQSSRGSYTFAEFGHLLNPWWYLVTIIIPDFFGNPATRNYFFTGTYIERVSYFGAIPLILAVWSILNFRKARQILPLLVLFVSPLILATDIFINRYLYALPFPLLSTTVPTRILGITIFAGCALSGFGLDMFIKRYTKKTMLFILIGGLFLFILLWTIVGLSNLMSNSLVLLDHISITKRSMLLPSFLFFSFMAFSLLYFFWHQKIKDSYQKAIIILAIFLLTIIDLFYFFQKITPFSPKKYVYPPTSVFLYLKQHGGINRFWSYGDSSIGNNIATYEQLFSPDGYDPLSIRRYAEFISTSRNGKIGNKIERSDVNIYPTDNDTDFISNYQRQKLLNILGVKYVLLRKGSHDFIGNAKNYQLVWQDSAWQIYENKNAVPRIFITNNYTVVSDPQKEMAKFYSPSFNEKESLLLEEDPHIEKAKNLAYVIHSIIYRPNRVSVSISSNQAGLLFLSDNFFPGWKVQVDNSNATIYRADYTFRAVKISNGSHVIVFSYQPTALNIGFWISILTILSVILGYLFRKYHYAKKRK